MDRFGAFRDFEETGGAMCRHCFHGESDLKPGDGIATVMWLNDCSFKEAYDQIAKTLCIDPLDKDIDDDFRIIRDLCLQKKMPLDSALAYGARAAKRGQKKVVKMPIYGPEGTVVSHFDMSPYETGQLNKGKIEHGGTNGIFLPGRKPKPGETWLIVEGPKDVCALHGLGFNAAGTLMCRLREGYESLFSGCTVIMVPDLDRPSLRGAKNTGIALEKYSEENPDSSIEVSLAILPGEIKPRGGNDVRDVIASQGSDAVLTAISEATAFDPEKMPEDRPAVCIDLEEANEKEVADAVIANLADQGFSFGEKEDRLYQIAGKLVQVAEVDEKQCIIRVGCPVIREKIAAGMDLVTYSGKNQEEKLVRPPEWLYRSISERPSYKEVRKLKGIVTTPTMRSDGSILQIPGYDPESELVYLPDGKFPAVPEFPTRKEALAARDIILDLVQDFPFVNDVARSAWLSMLLTLIGRPAIDGGCPMFCYSANIRGSGKTKLCMLVGLIVFGRDIGTKTLPRDEEETRKVLTSVAIEGQPAYLFDNVKGLIGNTPLDAALTAETWTDRILGKSETTGDLPWRTVLMATGNNLEFDADTARRVILCQLESGLENPEDRNDFAHENLNKFALGNRHRLAVAALTILRYFIVNGADYSGNRLGSFESWSGLICGSVVAVDLPNPLETVSVVREQDTSGNVLRMLIDGLETVCGLEGITSSEIEKNIKPNPDGNLNKKEFEFLSTALLQVSDKPTSRKIGGLFKKYKGRVSNGKRIVGIPGRANQTFWRVEILESACSNNVTKEEIDNSKTQNDEPEKGGYGLAS